MTVKIAQGVQRDREREQMYTIDPTADTDTLQYQRAYKCAKIPLGQSITGNTYIFTWQNPESNKIIIREVVVDITTQTAAAATIDIDVVANAASNAKTIFDALPLNAAGAFSSRNVDESGATATEKPHVMDEAGGSNDWLTGYESANQSYIALVGNVYVFYTEV